MNIHINNMLIEVTRKCNFYCQQCLRGNAQNVSINCDHVENVFKHVSSIGNLTLTGGEPQLAVEEIATIIFLAKKYKIDIGNFYVATNGSVNSKEFTLLMMELYMYCTENEISSVQVSYDYYHQLEYGLDFESLWISNLKFCSKRDENVQEDENFVSEGRWEGKSDNIIISSTLDTRYNKYGNSIEIDGEFYLNANGHILCGCDYSYENQERQIIGSAVDDWMMISGDDLISISDWVERESEIHMEED